jgi:hypothetical protein
MFPVFKNEMTKFLLLFIHGRPSFLAAKKQERNSKQELESFKERETMRALNPPSFVSSA